MTTFERTTPVFESHAIQIVIDSNNPLDTQLKMITGDGWNVHDWTDTLKIGVIVHKKSGLKIRVIN
jgi:hypothetical protein